MDKGLKIVLIVILFLVAVLIVKGAITGKVVSASTTTSPNWFQKIFGITPTDGTGVDVVTITPPVEEPPTAATTGCEDAENICTQTYATCLKYIQEKGYSLSPKLVYSEWSCGNYGLCCNGPCISSGASMSSCCFVQ